MYKVRIDRFEGPFDLLVYLLENARMDIYDIRVSEITEQYIAYLREMEEMDVPVDTEFIVLAAILIRLKSRMLLPRVNSAGEIVLSEDPREELKGRLLEYVRIKKLAEMLAERGDYYAALRRKPAEDMSEYVDNPDEILKATEEQMISAFTSFLMRKKKVEEVSRRYQRARRRSDTIEARIAYMSERLEERFSKGAASVMFDELLPERPDRQDIALSFMSLLSMIRNQGYDAEQKENYGPIAVTRKVTNSQSPGDDKEQAEDV